MAVGNTIIASAEPKGPFWEGYVNGALKPGTVVQIDVSEGLGNDGWPDWEAFNQAADGSRHAIAVLLEDKLQGKPATSAYVSGDRCFVYFPQRGDMLNMLIGDVGGTGDSHAFGEILIVDDTTGELIATTGTPESECFQLLETLAAPTADILALCLFTGY